ncbi:DEAD/DEAH box helicase family protein, partial [Micrococcus sp. GbtcB5]|uniref:DEAD/DEAH box helicase family protein n=1 Tax=Micrococcus sp. GbtcB5 TaxID=2824750 RepID=UPI0020C5F0DB
MLDGLNAERARGHHRNLLVAATGTGKTVIAGLDYRDMALRAGSPPTLLYVAHREEIFRLRGRRGRVS